MSIPTNSMESFLKWLRNRASKVGRILADNLTDAWQALLSRNWNEVLSTIRRFSRQIIALLTTENKLLILGPYQSGKTSLLLYLVYGEARKPEGPSGFMDTTEQVALLGESAFDIPVDLGGDEEFVRLGNWTTAIRERDPQCLLYVLDARKDVPTILHDLRESLKNSLSIYSGSIQNNQLTFKDEQRRCNLKVIYVLLNYYDHWKTEIHKTQNESLRLKVATALSDYLTDHDLPIAAVDAREIQLSPKASSWPEVNKALESLSLDIAKHFVVE